MLKEGRHLNPKPNIFSSSSDLYTYYSNKILADSKQLTNDLKRNRDYYGNGDIFIQRNIDLCNQYLHSIDQYTLKDIKRVRILPVPPSILTNFFNFNS